MSRWQPCKRRVFIKRLHNLGFKDPYSGTRHQFMVYQSQRLSIPSNSEFSIAQLRMMINEVESILDRSLSANEWNNQA